MPEIKYWLQACDYITWAVIQYYWPFFLLFILIVINKLRRLNSPQEWWYALILTGYFAILWAGTAYLLSKDQVWLSQVDALRRVFLFWPPAVIFWLAIELIENNQTDFSNTR